MAAGGGLPASRNPSDFTRPPSRSCFSQPVARWTLSTGMERQINTRQSTSKWFVKVVIILTAVFLGCDDPASRESEETGGGPQIRSIRNSPPYPTWAVRNAPILRIGAAMEEGEGREFTDVRYVGGLSDGGVVVVDGGSSEIRWFKDDGTLHSQAGGKGAGPGELGHVVSATLLAGDVLLLVDWRNQRLSWFDSKGILVKTHRVVVPSLSVTPHDIGNGRVLLAAEVPNFNFGGAEHNYAQDSLFAVLISDSPEPDTILRLPGKEAVTWIEYSANGEPRGTRQMDLPFGQRTLVGGLSNLIAVVSSGEGELVYFSLAGRVLQSAHRSDLDPPPISSGFRRRYVQSAADLAMANGARVATAREDAEGRLELLPDGRRVPVYDRMLIDHVGERIWLRDFMPPWTKEDPQSWTVHDRRGRVVARLTTPARFSLMQVAQDRLVGVSRGEMGVESVTVYQLRRPSPSP